MSQMGVKTGPIAPGFCPSDKGSAAEPEDEALQRLERENAELRLEVARLKRQL